MDDDANQQQLAALKRRTRVAAYWSFLGAFFIGGTAVFYQGPLGSYDPDRLGTTIGLVVTAVIFAAGGWGLLRMSRAAGMVLLVYHVSDRLFALASGEFTAGLGVSLIYLFFLVRAIIASYEYHGLRKDLDPDYRPAPRWYAYVGIPAGALAAVVLVMTLFVEAGLVPDVVVLRAEEIPRAHIELLREKDVVGPSERVDMFYSAGVASILEDGNLLTDSRVISYQLTGPQPELYAARYEDVDRIELQHAGSYVEDAVVAVLSGEDGFLVFLSTLEGRHTEFIAKLEVRSGVKMADMTTYVPAPVESVVPHHANAPKSDDPETDDSQSSKIDK